MIKGYFLCYWILDYAKRTLDDILANASESMEITIIEGNSQHSPEFLEWAKGLLVEKKIKRFVHASDNCKGWGLNWAIRQFPPEEQFFMCTDLDLLFKEPHDFIGRAKESFEIGAKLSGYTLDMGNYKTPNWGYDEEYNKQNSLFGNWHMFIDTEMFFNNYPATIAFEDSIVLSRVGPRIKHNDVPLIHLGWAAAWEHPDYWQNKLDNFGWQKPSEQKYEVWE